LNAAQHIRDDLHKIIVGDLLRENYDLAVHDVMRPGKTVTFIAHENTLDAVIATISYFIRHQEFSLDVRMANDKMAVIPVRVYDRLEGLI